MSILWGAQDYSCEQQLTGSFINATMQSDEPLRAALVLTGHLRGTCERKSGKGIATLVRQVAMCRAVFPICDLFLFTWDALDKPLPSQHSTSRCLGGVCKHLKMLAGTASWPCIANISALLSPVAVVVERQDRAYGLDEDARPWSRYESLSSFRMNGAAMITGADMVRRHASTMNHEYHALVRMRADVGSTNIDFRQSFREQFLTNHSWHAVRSIAEAERQQHTSRSIGVSHGSVPRAAAKDASSAVSVSRLVHQCEEPRLVRIDFCFWSVPATPVLATLDKLRYELSGNETHEAQCRDYLNGTFTAEFYCGIGMRQATYSEHILYCAMRAAGVSPSGLVTYRAKTGLRPHYYWRPRCSKETPKGKAAREAAVRRAAEAAVRARIN